MRLLYDILKIQSTSRRSDRMERFIIAECVRKGYDVDLDYRNIYVTKGDAPLYPCFVAHTDTVHSIIPDKRYDVRTQQGKIYGWDKGKKNFTGVGGDDKVGIYIALECLDQLPYGKAVFFYDEEIGCVGSSDVNLKFFNDCAFVLQADRKGNEDFVALAVGVELFGDDFQDAIAPILLDFDFRFEYYGGMTDVSTLKELGMDVACANVSCGYYNPHRHDEFIVIKEVQHTLQLFLTIGRDLAYKRWEHVDDRPTYPYEFDAWGQQFLDKSKKGWYNSYEDRCAFCGKEGVLEYSDEEQSVFCWNCQEYVGGYVLETR